MSKELIGRVCVKLTGREANKTAVIVNKLDKNMVLLDGNVKRRSCNLAHLEMIDKVLDIKEGATTDEVHQAMNKEGIKITKRKERQVKEKHGKKQ